MAHQLVTQSGISDGLTHRKVSPCRCVAHEAGQLAVNRSQQGLPIFHRASHAAAQSCFFIAGAEFNSGSTGPQRGGHSGKVVADRGNDS